MSVINGHVIVDGKPIEDLKVTELRKQLEIRNLSKSGVKKDLCERLKNYILSEENSQQASVPVNVSAYNEPTEYRSLCEVRPTSKQPSSKPQPSDEPNLPECAPESRPVQLDVAENLMPKSANNVLPQEVQEQEAEVQFATEETFHTGNKISAAFSDEPRQSENTDETCSINVLDEVENEEAEKNRREADEINQSAECIVIAERNDTVVYDEEENDVSHALDDDNHEESSNSDSSESSKNQEISADELAVSSPAQEDNFEKDQCFSNAQKKCNTSLSQNTEKESDNVEAKKLAENDMGHVNDDLDERKQDDELDYDEEFQEGKKRFKLDSSSLIQTQSSNSSEVQTENLKEKKCDSELVEAEQAELKIELTLEGFVRRREVSPARNKISQYLHIRNLKRPFTTKILKELLGNFGKISEDEFWIDEIKTNCIVKFETEEQAELARNRLHNVVWPVSSDLSLIVEYTTDEKLKRRRGDDAPMSNDKLGITITVDNRTNSSNRRSSIDLLGRNSELPKKQLEDLFRKTITQPSVYYLPLSDSEAEKRWAKKKQLIASNNDSSSRHTGNGSVDNHRRYSSSGRPGLSPDRKRERRESPIRRRR